MLIEIPVVITFDFDNTWRAGPRQNARVFTMRYDTASGDKPAQFTNIYPPSKNCAWMTDRDGVLFMLFSDEIDKAIAKRAEADPETYRVLAAAE